MPPYEKIKKIEAVVGKEKTLQMIWLCSGNRYYVPSVASFDREMRNDRLVGDYIEMKASKVKRAELKLAERYGLSPRWVRRIVKRRLPNEL